MKKDPQFYNKEAFHHLFSIEEDHFWFRARNKLIIWAISQYFLDAKNFLEIGCGTGYVISGIQKKFPNLKLYAADIFLESQPYVRYRLGDQATIFQMDARKIPYKDKFDFIGIFDVLEHIQEDELVISEMYKSLKKGGGVLLTVPQHPWLWSALDSAAHHVRRYRVNELQNKLIQGGFKVILSTSFVSLLFPLLLMSRLRFTGKPIAQEENPKNKYVHLVLEKLLGCERLLIKTGIRFPFGGSRFIVAQKQAETG